MPSLSLTIIITIIFEDGTVVHLSRTHPPTLALASTHEDATRRKDLSQSGDQLGVSLTYTIGPRTGCPVGHTTPTSIAYRSIHPHPRWVRSLSSGILQRYRSITHAFSTALKKPKIVTTPSHRSGIRLRRGVAADGGLLHTLSPPRLRQNGLRVLSDSGRRHAPHRNLGKDRINRCFQVPRTTEQTQLTQDL